MPTPGLLCDSDGLLTTDDTGLLIMGETGDACCCATGWIRAVACDPETEPQVIVTRLDPSYSPTCGTQDGACPIVGGLTVLYRSRCYVIEAGEVELPPECQIGAFVFAARVYQTIPEGLELVYFDCLPPEEGCDSPSCQLPPPVGCCLEDQSSPACPGGTQTQFCEGGRDVTMTWNGVYEQSRFNPQNGLEESGSRTTYSAVIRGVCVGEVTTLTVLSARSTVITRSFGQPPVTTVYDPDTSVQRTLFGPPGRPPPAHPRGLVRWGNLVLGGCVGETSTSNSNESWNVSLGCRAGSGTYSAEVRLSPSASRSSSETASWGWSVAEDCNRGTGLGDIKL